MSILNKNRALMALALAFLCDTIPGALIEQAQGPHAPMFQLQVQPAAGTATVQPEDGVVIRRITNLPLYKTKYPSVNWSNYPAGKPYLGLTDGYSRFECVSPDGKLLIAFGSTPMSILFNALDLTDLRLLTSKYEPNVKIGDLQETKWNPADGMIYHAAGRCEYRQDPVTGAEELVYDFGKNYFHTSDGSFSNDGRILAMALIDGYTTKGVTIVNDVVVIDVVARKEICRVRYGRQPAGVDVSGDGKYLKIDNFFYDIPSGAYRNHNEAGHGGWAIDKNGREWFVNQNTKTDWIEAFDPATSQTLFLMRMGNWAGMHAASDKRCYFPGHSLISTYKSSDSDPLGNNVFFLELKSQKPAGMTHPYYGKTTKAQFDAVNLPVSLVRVCPMQHRYIMTPVYINGILQHNSDGTTKTVGNYFTEGWASVGPDHCVYWGGNWHGTDNLELYRAELPADVLAAAGAAVQPIGGKTVELYAGCNVPEWGISNYPIGPEGVQQNLTYAGSQSHSNTTCGNYIAVNAGRHDRYEWPVNSGIYYTSWTFAQNNIVNSGMLLYWNLAKVPKGLKIKRAYIGLWTDARYTELGGNTPTGDEQVPFRTITNPKHYPTIWTCAFLKPGALTTKEPDWNGASWHNWYEDAAGKGQHWSDIDVGSPSVWGTGVGRYGPLATVLRWAPQDPIISFNPDRKSMSRSSDMTALVQGWLDGSIENWGVYLDTDNCRGKTYFSTPGKSRPGCVCRVGIMTAYQAPETRPRLVLEY